MTQRPQYTQSYAEFVGQPLQQPIQQPARQQTSQLLGTPQFQQYGSELAVTGAQPVATVGSDPTGRSSVEQEAAAPTAGSWEASRTEQVGRESMTQQQPAGKQPLQYPVQQPAQQQQPHQQAGGQATSLQQQSQQWTGQQLPTQSVTTAQRATQQPLGQVGRGESMGAGAGTGSQMAMQGVAQSPSAAGGAGAASPETLGQPGLGTQAPVQQAGIPPIDMIDAETELLVVVDVPGFEKKDINIKVADNSLQIAASGRTRDLSETETMVTQERPTAIQRQIQLPTPVVVDDASASYEDGVLSVELPKDEDETTVGTQIGIQ
ncbi:MAG: Hsp20/alpha crystallin family protein [Halobaculum sp.]